MHLRPPPARLHEVLRVAWAALAALRRDACARRSAGRFLESAPTYDQPIVPKGTKPSDGGTAQQPAQQPAAGEKKKRKAGGKKKGKMEL